MTTPSRPTKHVLVVEDHAESRMAFSRALTQQGFLVYPRASAEEARAREKEHRTLDMAVLDVKLPGESGDEYAQTLRSRFPRVPIVFITASLDKERIAKALPDAQILVKPVDVKSLLESFIY